MLETVGIPLAIFALRVLGNLFTTMRLIMISRGRANISFFIAVGESLLFALVLGVVVSNLNSIANLLAYSVGFAVGGYIAMRLEQRLIIDYLEVNTISVQHGHEIAEAIRAQGFGATETPGYGGKGDVMVVRSVIERRQLKQCLVAIYDVDDHAFTTTHALRGTRHGFIQVQPGLSRLFGG